MSSQPFLPVFQGRAQGAGSRTGLRCLTWNLRNPSVSRAADQAVWLEERQDDVLILSELKAGLGTELLRGMLLANGYTVAFSDECNGDYGVLVAVAPVGEVIDWGLRVLPHRGLAVRFGPPGADWTIVGLYVPSRGPAARRNEDKRAFQGEVSQCLGNLSNLERVVVGGDLNVVEPCHRPRHSVFGAWEYRFYDDFGRSGLVDAFRVRHPEAMDHSWFGRSGEGYRFDHFFVSSDLSGLVEDCGYCHEVRLNKLSDHSAMCMTLNVRPKTAAAPSGGFGRTPGA